MTSSGAVLCWGHLTGDGTFETRLTPVSVVGLSSDVLAVESGFSSSCVLTSSGGVKCWGLNQFGAAGDSTTANRLIPVDVVGLKSGVAAIANGDDSVCASLKTGGAKCWGLRAGGLLAAGSSAVPLDVPGLTNIAVAISTGGSTSCAVSSGGSVKCWGYNSNGELGDGTTTSKSAAVEVVGLGNGVVSIAVDSNHSCISINDGTVKCWGANWDGQLGDGTTINRLTPVTVGGL